MGFKAGQRVRIRETEVTLAVPEYMYPGAEGTVVAQSAIGYVRVLVDNVREDDVTGKFLIEEDGGWLYAQDELEAI